MNPLSILENLPWFAAILLPLSGTANHEISVVASWHGRLMVLAWGVFIPLGVLVARYFKITPQQKWPQELDNKTWWRGHLFFQNSGFMVALLGLYLIWGVGAGATTSQLVHAYLGYAVSVLAAVQILSGYARGTKGGPTDVTMRGDHYDMSAKRKAFEHVHKSLGWLAVFLAIATLLMGLVVADAPRWMLLVLLLWWAALASIAYAWQKQNRCVDTYQAIWGADMAHPGNHMPSIGWGITRQSAQSSPPHQ